MKKKNYGQLHKIVRNSTQFVVKWKWLLQIPKNSASFCSLFGKKLSTKNYSTLYALTLVMRAQKMKLFEKKRSFQKSPEILRQAGDKLSFAWALIFSVALRVKNLSRISYESALSALQDTYLFVIKRLCSKKVLSKILEFFCRLAVEFGLLCEDVSNFLELTCDNRKIAYLVQNLTLFLLVSLKKIYVPSGCETSGFSHENRRFWHGF